MPYINLKLKSHSILIESPRNQNNLNNEFREMPWEEQQGMVASLNSAKIHKKGTKSIGPYIA
jgi:hypothetical protein